MRAEAASSPIMVSEVTDFPEPLSPTTATTSPLFTVKDTPLSACWRPERPLKLTLRSLTASTGRVSISVTAGESVNVFSVIVTPRCPITARYGHVYNPDRGNCRPPARLDHPDPHVRRIAPPASMLPLPAMIPTCSPPNACRDV